MNWCCVQWEALYPELYILKDAEIQELIKNKVPKSVFASLLKVMGEMGNYCPACGKGVKVPNPTVEEDIPVRDKSNFVKQESGLALPTEKLEKMYKPKTCHACRGRKEVSSGVLCMTCHGKGTIGYHTAVKGEGGEA